MSNPRMGAVAIAIVAVMTSASWAERYKLGKGDIVGEHAKQCRGLEVRTWLQRIVRMDPVIECTADGGMTIKTGDSESLPADHVDKLTAHWKLNDDNTLIVTLDPMRHAHEMWVSVGIVHRADDSECSERWIGSGVRQ